MLALWWLVWIVPLCLTFADGISLFSQKASPVQDVEVDTIAINKFLDSDSSGSIFDFLRVEDDRQLINMMDPHALFEEFKSNLSQNNGSQEETADDIDKQLGVLHQELESIYLKLFNVAQALSSITPEEFLDMADKLAQTGQYSSLFEANHEHRNVTELNNIDIEVFGFGVDLELENDPEDEQADTENEIFGVDEKEISGSFESIQPNEGNSTYYDPEYEVDSFLDALVDENNEKVEALGSVLHMTGGIKKKLRKLSKSPSKKKKKFSRILKLIKLKKIIKRKRIKLCLKIMITIEKIKRTIFLIKSLIMKLIKYLIKQFPFDVLWKIKVIIVLILRIVDDLLWSTEIKILTVIAKVMKLSKILKLVPVEIIMYYKSELSDKLSATTRKEDMRSKEYDDWEYFNELINEDDEDFENRKTNYAYYRDNGIDHEPSRKKGETELDKIYRNSFSASELKNIFERHDFFNLDANFVEDKSDRWLDDN